MPGGRAQPSPPGLAWLSQALGALPRGDAERERWQARLGPEVPVHFVRFHPDYRMRDSTRTPIPAAHSRDGEIAGCWSIGAWTW